MAAEVIWAERALNDLQEIAAFIGRDSPRFAVLTVERIVRSAERLAGFPRFGRIVPEYDDPMLREITWQKYRIVYRTRDGAVAIVPAVHGAGLLRGLEEP